MKNLLKDLMHQRVVTPVSPEECYQGFYSRIFLIKKPSGNFHLILNLKPLNKSVLYKKFCMDSIFTVRNMLTKECFMASIDLRGACLHIPIAPQFLRLAVNMGREVLHLQFRALPFGLSSAPQVFTKVMAEALTPLHLQGIAVIPYLDDLLFFAPAREVARIWA